MSTHLDVLEREGISPDKMCFQLTGRPIICPRDSSKPAPDLNDKTKVTLRLRIPLIENATVPDREDVTYRFNNDTSWSNHTAVTRCEQGKGYYSDYLFVEMEICANAVAVHLCFPRPEEGVMVKIPVQRPDNRDPDVSTRPYRLSYDYPIKDETKPSPLWADDREISLSTTHTGEDRRRVIWVPFFFNIANDDLGLYDPDYFDALKTFHNGERTAFTKTKTVTTTEECTWTIDQRFLDPCIPVNGDSSSISFLRPEHPATTEVNGV